MTRACAIALVVAAVVGAPSCVDDRDPGCSCARPTLACQEAWDADAVFVGRVMTIVPERDANDPDAFPMYRRVGMEVREVFRGLAQAPSSTVDILTTHAGERCAIPFVEEQTYLIYAKIDKGDRPVLRTNACSRTQAIEKAAEDLAYLRSLTTDRPRGGRVLGRIRVFDLRPADDEWDVRERHAEAKPVPHIPVTLRGDAGVWQTLTNDDGRYEFRDLAADTYRVELDQPDTYCINLQPEYFEARLADVRACRAMDYWISHNGRVHGRVVDARGAPVSGVTVALFPISPFGWVSFDSAQASGITGADGSYEVQRAAPGLYAAAVSTGRRYDAWRQPHVPAHVVHPGLTTATGATIVNLGAGEGVSLDEWRFPESFTFVTLAGAVTSADGPVDDIRIMLALEKDDGVDGRPSITTIADTDAGGRFRLSALAGGRYHLTASRTYNVGDGRCVTHGRAGPFVAATDAPPIAVRLETACFGPMRFYER